MKSNGRFTSGMTTLASFLQLNMLTFDRLINNTRFFFSTPEAFEDNVMLANHRPIADVVDESLSTPKQTKANRAMSVLMYISPPNITDTMPFKQVKTKFLEGIETCSTLRAAQRGTN